MEGIYYKNDAPIPVLIYTTGPNSNLSIYIINKWNPKRIPNTIEPRIDFWEEYRDELLDFRNTPRVKELDKEIGNRLNQLKGLDSDLLEKIKEKREKYREEYHFTKYEIDPKLKELEEW